MLSNADVGVADSGLAINDDHLDWVEINGDVLEREEFEGHQADDDDDTTPVHHYSSATADTHSPSNSNLSHETTALQMSLLAMETNLHNREREIVEMKSFHSNEIDNVLLQQEKMRDELLQEQAVKFTREINQMKEQMSLLRPSTTATTDDDDEIEAKRVQQLKSTLKHIHEQEVEKIHLLHQQEKALLAEENEKRLKELLTACDERIESNKKQLEQLANDQIKQIHSQFMVSYNALMKQKCDIEDKHRLLAESATELQQTFNRVSQEKEIAENKVRELEESHSVEIRAIKESSFELERRLREWKEKASGLQERIDETSQSIPTVAANSLEQKIMDLQQQLQSKEEELSLLLDKRTEIQQQEKEEETVQQLKAQLVEEQSANMTKLSEIEESHKLALKELESQHCDQIKRLQESLSESSKSQASLEFAEVHMKELQQQLNAYRNQEMNHKTAMEQAKLDQQMEVRRVREIGESKCTDMVHAHQLEKETLSQRIEELEKCVHKKEAEFQSALDEIAEKNKAEINVVMETLTNQLTAEHGRKMGEVISQHQLEVDGLKADHSRELSVSLETLQQKLEKEKNREIKQLSDGHENALSKLKNSLSESGEEALRNAQSHIIDLEMASRESEEKLKELRSLQERTQKLETELRAKEVDLSISQSELNEEKLKHTNTKETLDKLVNEFNTAQLAISELKNSLITEREESAKQLEEMVQERQDEAATHQVHLTSQQSRISELTDELAQERKVSETLRVEVNTLSQNNEAVATSSIQLHTIQSQLAEAKERCSSLLKEWEDKEEEQEKLKDELTSAQQTFARQEKEYRNRITQLELQLTESSGAAAQALEETKQQLQEATREKERVMIEMSSLNAQLQSQRTDRHKEQQDLLDTTEEMKSDNEALIQELEEIKSKYAILEQERNDLMIHMNQLQLEVRPNSMIILYCLREH